MQTPIQPVIPVLVPIVYKPPITVNGKGPLPNLETTPHPTAVTARCGDRITFPTHDFDLSIFQGGEIGKDPLCMSFKQAGNLLASQEDELAAAEIYQCRSRIWNLTRQHQANTEIFERAYAACGLAEMGSQKPYGHFNIHLYDRFVAYSEPDPPGPFRLVADNMTRQLSDRLYDVADPQDMIFRIASFHDHRPSSHMLLNTLARLTKWLDWLAPNQGWPPFAPLRSLPVWELQR